MDRKKRAKLPKILEKRIYQEANSKCAFCSENEILALEIHHIDSDPANNTYDNLILVCSTCHSKITGGLIVEADVRLKKAQLKQPGKHRSGAFTADDIKGMRPIPNSRDPDGLVDFDNFSLRPEDF